MSRRGLRVRRRLARDPATVAQLLDKAGIDKTTIVSATGPPREHPPDFSSLAPPVFRMARAAQ